MPTLKKTGLTVAIATGVALMFGSSTAAAEDRKDTLSACIDTGFSDLISAKSRDYSSKQFYLVCQHRDVNKRERSETFTYRPAEGFKIVSARAKVVLKSSEAGFRDLAFEQKLATINLHCKGRPDADHVHDAIAVHIVGRLEYMPTREDAKTIAGLCLDQALRR